MGFDGFVVSDWDSIKELVQALEFRAARDGIVHGDRLEALPGKFLQAGEKVISIIPATPPELMVTIGEDDTNTIFDGLINGTGSIIKAGTGTLTLNEDPLWNGSLTVNEGTLEVQGIITDLVTVGTDGSLSPSGAGIGTPEAIQVTWSAHREIISDQGPAPDGWEIPPVR